MKAQLFAVYEKANFEQANRDYVYKIISTEKVEKITLGSNNPAVIRVKCAGRRRMLSINKNYIQGYDDESDARTHAQNVKNVRVRSTNNENFIIAFPGYARRSKLKLIENQNYSDDQLGTSWDKSGNTRIFHNVATKEFLLLSAPGSESYPYDRWAPEEDGVFFYTGEDTTAYGDQKFSNNNLFLKNAVPGEDSIYLFTHHDSDPKINEMPYKFIGEFIPDLNQRWCRGEAPGGSSGPRSLIVFRLNRSFSPVGRNQGQEAFPSKNEISGSKFKTELVPTEEGRISEYMVDGRSETMANRRERELENLLIADLKSKGSRCSRQKITLPEVAGPLFTDTWDETKQELYEVKSSIARSSIREAIGQLLDYKRFITPPPRICTVMLPEYPGFDLTALIHSCGFDLVFRDEGTQLQRKSAPTQSRKK